MRHHSELTAILMPDDFIQLEWTLPVADTFKDSSQVMQDDTFARFTQEPQGWRFFLGFCAENISPSPLLTF